MTTDKLALHDDGKNGSRLTASLEFWKEVQRMDGMDERPQAIIFAHMYPRRRDKDERIISVTHR